MSHNYDFRSLSPIEFEELCVDLTATELGLPFETFAEGRDWGIDGRNMRGGRSIIVQVKHYRNSDFGKLAKDAGVEGEKLKSLSGLTRYIFITSQNLNPQQKDKLKVSLGHPSVSVSDIWGRTELNALLKKHGDVELRNTKLWMPSTAVLISLLNKNILGASRIKLRDIERTVKIYVTTRVVGRALEILSKHHCLVISGPPGAGKTSLSHILAATFVSKGWKLVSIDKAEYGALEEGEKQIFLFDDFLGTIGLESSLWGRDQETLIRFFEDVRRTDGKLLVLTSRSYILQAAREKSEALDADRFRLADLVLNLSAYTRRERALILYNHLYHSKIDTKAISALIESGRIGQIIDHPNYMPRLIESMTDQLLIQDIAPSDYPSAFLKTLNSPEKIWEKPYKSHISQRARVLLLCAFVAGSRMRGGVRVDEIEPFFNRSLERFRLSSDPRVGGSMLEDTIREINSSFVTIDEGIMNFVNPSLQDYLDKQVRDSKILSVLLEASHSYLTTMRIWSSARYLPPNELERLAATIISSITSGRLSGEVRVDIFFDFIKDMLSIKNDRNVVAYLRRRVCLYVSWDAPDLPAFISRLRQEYYPNIRNTETYARFFSLELFRFVQGYPSLSDLALLASNLIEYPIVCSDGFKELFADRSTFTINELTLPDREQMGALKAENWLADIAKIESYLPLAVEGKKQELQDFVDGYNQHRQVMESDYRFGPTKIDWPGADDPGSSNAEVSKLFATLLRGEEK
ncbi:hypothetical protein X731_03865 [Mesorhizobium sp. L2C054A000]|nr:restriction endonuclease [Mesorhizobium sp. L2C054A000]ESZ51717.1 hypothetical protein X731_03865 [Mesorhizobium sp. L2C054A000]